jgi:hypothetical protein
VDGAVERAAAELRALLPGATLCARGRHSTKLRFELAKRRRRDGDGGRVDERGHGDDSSDGGGGLAEVFELMEQRRERLRVLDFACSGPSLESVFLAVAPEGAALPVEQSGDFAQRGGALGSALREGVAALLGGPSRRVWLAPTCGPPVEVLAPLPPDDEAGVEAGGGFEMRPMRHATP